MRRFVVLFIALFMVMNINAHALNSGAVAVGSDIREDEKAAVFKVLAVDESVPQVNVTNDEEIKHLSGILPEGMVTSRAVICSYVKELPENEGIRVGASNITYVNSEMIASVMITAGLRDADVRVASPYRLSGYSSLSGVIKAYESLVGEAIPENAEKTAVQELVLMGELGQKIGMRKSLQFVNEIKKEVIKASSLSLEDRERIVRRQEERFNIELDEGCRNRAISLMGMIGSLNLTLEDVSAQQKNIAEYINDLSETAMERGILGKLLDDMLDFFKRVSKIFSGK